MKTVPDDSHNTATAGLSQPVLAAAVCINNDAEHHAHHLTGSITAVVGVAGARPFAHKV